MSANRWSKCLVCQAKRAADKINALAEAEAAYGKVPAAKYKRLLDAANQGKPGDLDETLREDWELGIDVTTDGVRFALYYEASCQRCGFNYLKRLSEPVALEVKKSEV